ncbi:hypothetical protein [Plantactinospora sp. KBS50]|uniref:hypothetical protein n=1 Tax=Plantactinospora sp. KBS50 TaxID=2024580 RepID=UPI000BAACCBF|nr:hypothetical protein [Plantactinospora sp. KBS50]ASW56805.1 hypothetical protein CIK06_25575 [Plantactinospora sp. KBS50]
MPRDRLDHDLEEMTGDPAIARDIKKTLRQLADGTGGPTLAELARNVLDGRTTLRSAASSDAYATPLTDAINQFRQWHEQLPPEQRRQILDDTRRRLHQATDNTA